MCKEITQSLDDDDRLLLRLLLLDFLPRRRRLSRLRLLDRLLGGDRAYLLLLDGPERLPDQPDDLGGVRLLGDLDLERCLGGVLRLLLADLDRDLLLRGEELDLLLDLSFDFDLRRFPRDELSFLEDSSLELLRLSDTLPTSPDFLLPLSADLLSSDLERRSLRLSSLTDFLSPLISELELSFFTSSDFLTGETLRSREEEDDDRDDLDDDLDRFLLSPSGTCAFRAGISIPSDASEFFGLVAAGLEGRGTLDNCSASSLVEFFSFSKEGGSGIEEFSKVSIGNKDGGRSVTLSGGGGPGGGGGGGASDSSVAALLTAGFVESSELTVLVTLLESLSDLVLDLVSVGGTSNRDR